MSDVALLRYPSMSDMPEELDLFSAPIADLGDTENAPDADAAAQEGRRRRRKADVRADPTLQEKERAEIISAVDAAQLTTNDRRVAWLLNRYPEARDSDAKLWRLYWTTFENDLLDGEYVHLDSLNRITSPTSITRSRAYVQNDLGLFLASPEVRGRRGTLSEEEKAHFQSLPRRKLFPSIAAYGDEAGKTEEHIVVGTAWFLHGPDQLQVMRSIQELATEWKFEHELHFKQIDARRLPFYRAVVDRVLDAASTIAFTSGNVERRGHKNVDEVVRQLYYQVLLRSIRHHHESGRAPLPRTLIFVKDAENAGPDRLLLADLEDRLRQASEGQFGGALEVDRLGVDDSKQNLLIQLADLYTSSVSRVLNRTGKPGPKDAFSEYFLARLGQPTQPEEEHVGDLSVHLRLGAPSLADSSPAA